MDVTEERSGAALVLQITGRIDSNTAQAFEAALVQAVGKDRFVVVDMKQVEYVSSAGLRALLVAAKKARAGGGVIKLAAMAAHIREVFDISGFTSLFDIQPDVAAAAAAVK